MLLSNVLPRVWGANRNGSNGTATIAENLKNDGEEKVVFEMNLHVPCRVAGITRKGSRWEGETTTLSLSSFGAQLLLPMDAELDGDISLVFKIPGPLRVLFPKKTFRLKAEIRPSGAAGPGLAPMGRKVVYAAFAEPLKFRFGAARSGK